MAIQPRHLALSARIYDLREQVSSNLAPRLRRLYVASTHQSPGSRLRSGRSDRSLGRRHLFHSQDMPIVGTRSPILCGTKHNHMRLCTSSRNCKSLVQQAPDSQSISPCRCHSGSCRLTPTETPTLAPATLARLWRHAYLTRRLPFVTAHD